MSKPSTVKGRVTPSSPNRPGNKAAKARHRKIKAQKAARRLNRK